MQLLSGLLLGIVVAILAWRAGALSPSGAFGAALTGGLIFGLGGLPWAALLLTFFITSSALSRLFRGHKTALNEKFAKGSRRDIGQVLANGGVGAGLVVLHALFPGLDGWWVAFAGAFAAVNADTWATELGVLSWTQPRLITTGKPVERGASGAVSLLGYGAVLAGSGLVAFVGAVFNPAGEIGSLKPDPAAFLAAVILGGLAGATFDSTLGATVQAIYYCPVCHKETERHPHHSCGTETHLLRGWPWLDNDWVNALSSGIGAGAAVLVWALLAG